MMQFMPSKSLSRFRQISNNLSLCGAWSNGFCLGASVFAMPRQVRSSRSRHVPFVVSQRIRQDVFVNVNYKDRIVTARKAWSNLSPKSALIFEAMKKEPTNVTLSNASVEELVSFVADISSLSLSQFDNSLRKNLETECCRRVSSLDQKTMLYLADAFFVMNLASEQYLRAVFQEFERRWNNFSLTKQDILQLSFFLSVLRTSSIFLMHKVEEFICEHMSWFTINEIGLICHAFFTTNTAFRNFRTLENLSNLVLSNIDKEAFHVGLLVNVMKTMRHAQFSSIQFYKELGTILYQKQRLHDATLSDLASLLFTYSSLRIIHPELANYIYALTRNKCSSKKLNNVRMKDLSRLLWSGMMLHVKIPKDMLENLVKIMRKDSKLSTQYPEAFVEALLSLAVNQIYPGDLLEYVFSPKCLQFKSGRLLEQHFQLLLLNSLVQIECANHSSKQLPKTYLTSCPKELFGNLGYELRTRQGLLSLIETLHRILGDSSYVRCHFILPHSRITDVELRFDSNNHPVMFSTMKKDDDDDDDAVLLALRSKFLQTSSDNLIFSQESSVSQTLLRENHEEFRADLKSVYLKASKPGSQKRISIKVMGWNQYALNEPVLLGLHLLELKLLTQLGYDVVAINPELAQQLDNSSAEKKEEIVRNLLENCGIHLQ